MADETPYAPNPLWADYVRKLVDEAPPLSPAQVSRLAVLLQTAPAPAPQTKKATHGKPAA